MGRGEGGRRGWGLCSVQRMADSVLRIWEGWGVWGVLGLGLVGFGLSLSSSFGWGDWVCIGFELGLFFWVGWGGLLL